MKALIVGNYGVLMNGLIQRLDREKIDIYVLSEKNQNGEKKKKGLPRHVNFEFDFGGEDAKYIIQCVLPDIVIYMGIYNDYYDWSSEVTAAKFSGDLTNILQWSKYYQVRKFIYLSSLSVYENNATDRVTEGILPEVSSDKYKLVYNGEQLVGLYNREMTTVSLRFPFIYGTTQSVNEQKSCLSQMCYELMKDHAVHSLGYKKYMVLYVNDAVDAVFRIIKAEKVLCPVYHVPGERLTDDQEIVSLMNHKLQEADPECSESGHVVDEKQLALSLGVGESRFADEFGYRTIMDLESGITIVVKDMIKHFSTFEKKEKEEEKQKKEERRKEAGTKVRAIGKSMEHLLENLVFFSGAVVLYLCFHNLDMFQNVDFFLFYIILMAASLGIGSGIVAVVLSTGAEMLYRMSEGYSISAWFGSYNTVVIFLYRFIIAVLIAYNVRRLQNSKKELMEELEDLSEDYEMITEINKTNVEIKQIFEDRLLNYKDSIGKIYNIVSELDLLDPEQIVDASLDVIYKIMGVSDISIYQVSSQGYGHHIVSSSPEARGMDKSIRLMDYPEMENVLRNQDIFINREVDSVLPRMAAPIFSGDQMIYIIMLWNMEFEQLTLYQKNLFMVLAKIITGTLEKASRYENDAHSLKYYENTNILREEYFDQIVENLQNQPDNRRRDYTLLEVENTKEISLPELSNELDNILRDSDRFGCMSGKPGKIYILAQCTLDEVHFVQSKLNRIGYVGKVMDNA